MAPQVFLGMQILEMVVNFYLVSAYKIDVAVGTVLYKCLVITHTPL